jgi:hypothetical protein
MICVGTLVQNDDLLNLQDLHESEGEAAERIQQIARAAYAHTKTNLYAISPEKSHVSKEFAASDSEFWTAKPPGANEGRWWKEQADTVILENESPQVT